MFGCQSRPREWTEIVNRNGHTGAGTHKDVIKITSKHNKSGWPLSEQNYWCFYFWKSGHIITVSTYCVCDFQKNWDSKCTRRYTFKRSRRPTKILENSLRFTQDCFVEFLAQVRQLFYFPLFYVSPCNSWQFMTASQYNRNLFFTCCAIVVKLLNKFFLLVVKIRRVMSCIVGIESF